MSVCSEGDYIIYSPTSSGVLTQEEIDAEISRRGDSDLSWTSDMPPVDHLSGGRLAETAARVDSSGISCIDCLASCIYHVLCCWSSQSTIERYNNKNDMTDEIFHP